MSKEFRAFLNPEIQHENYKKIGIDKSVVEINQTLFWEQNKNFYEMKEKYKTKKKGIQLKDNHKLDKFVKTGSVFGKFKKNPIQVSLNGSKRVDLDNDEIYEKEIKKI